MISFFPYTIPAIVIGLMWGRIFDPSAGLVNGILLKLGLDQFKDFPWLGNESTAMPVTIFIILWATALVQGAKMDVLTERHLAQTAARESA